MLIKTEPVEEILKLTFASGYVKNAYPLSVLVTSHVGAGKTSILKKFIINKGVAFLSDVTAYGIIQSLYKEIKSNEVKHIIIPDLIAPLSKSKSTVNTFISFMNSLIEEGVFRISTYAVQIEEPIRCGLVTSIAREDLFSGYRRETWHKVGFLSRMLPVSYSYSQADIIKILEQLHKELVDKDVVKLKLKSKKIEMPEEFHKELIPYAMRIADSMKLVCPFRQMKQLDILAMSNALLENRKEVTKEDVEKVKELCHYINLDFNPL